ncbi:MAG: LysE family transporter [Zoogloeaceae bacterium]|jgi:homoserine/homoserine lactone efflux protein|nr:LysE family transporter [Zoogloeaceae bacterium]
MTLHLWLAFCAANLLTSLSLGPGALASMDAGRTYGEKRALWLIFGLQAALLSQLALACLGVAALLLTSEVLSVLLRFLGAGYLLWLGVRQWRQIVFPAPLAFCAATGNEMKKGGLPMRLFRRGALVNFSNPKAILFQAALVPHFIDPARALPPQYGVIALTMCVIDTLVMALYAALARRIARPSGETLSAPNWASFIFGASFILFGVLLLGADLSR